MSDVNSKNNSALLASMGQLLRRWSGRDAGQEIATLRRDLAALQEKMTWELRYERERIDYALGRQEGLEDLRAELIRARQTPEFQAAFEERSPLVTVCTGTAGRPDLLVERCLKSLQAQTYSNLQILVIGDHCIDGTADRIAELDDPRIEFFNLPERGPYPPPGPDRWLVAGANAGNASNGLARGRFITFLDDDDTCERDRIETLVAAAQELRAEFLWHQFWYRQPDGQWLLWGNGRLEHGQVSNSTIFYHSFFTKVPWDLAAYRVAEPGDWNRIRKIKYLRPRMHFIPRPLFWYHRNYEPTAFVAQPGERFLE